MTEDFAAELRDFAGKVMRIRHRCRSEEATKIYLVLPFLALLGYDTTDPTSLVPEHDAEPQPSGHHRVDFAIVRDGLPAIAVEVRAAGASLVEARAQLSRYFNAMTTARLAIATNGSTYELFLDAEAAGTLDAEPFLTLDLEAIDAGAECTEAIDLLALVRAEVFDPVTLVEHAMTSLLRQRIKTLLIEEFRTPSDELCRLLMMKLDMRNVHAATIDRHFRPLVRQAIDQALVRPVLEALRQPVAAGVGDGAAAVLAGDSVVATSDELEVLDYIKSRLSFLVRTDEERAAIARLSHRDYIGRFAVYTDRDCRRRLLDYIALGDGRHRFVFPDLDVDLVLSSLEELDVPLYAAFSRKVAEQRRAA